jgi:hypothetical protein
MVHLLISIGYAHHTIARILITNSSWKADYVHLIFCDVIEQDAVKGAANYTVGTFLQQYMAILGQHKSSGIASPPLSLLLPWLSTKHLLVIIQRNRIKVSRKVPQTTLYRVQVVMSLSPVIRRYSKDQKLLAGSESLRSKLSALS